MMLEVAEVEGNAEERVDDIDDRVISNLRQRSPETTYKKGLSQFYRPLR